MQSLKAEASGMKCPECEGGMCRMILLQALWCKIIIMDKKEYLKNRFKRDFLQYSLLQNDSLPAKEITEKLYGVIDLNWLTVKGKHDLPVGVIHLKK